MQVLPIEDDVRTAAAVTDILSRDRIAVRHAADGERGLGLAGDPVIDVIVVGLDRGADDDLAKPSNRPS